MRDIFQGDARPLSTAGLTAAATALGIGDDCPLWALLAVETRGFGFLPDRRPQILFERHIFHNRTDGRFSAANPDISNASSGGYAGGAMEYQRLKRAMVLDRKAALESASWGLGQVMGFNATSLRYASVDAMIEAFMESEDRQLDGSVRFILSKPPLLHALQNNEWTKVAFFYNGANFAANNYHIRLDNAFKACGGAGRPDIQVRTAQAYLTFLGFNPKGVDGQLGPGTRAAIRAYRKRHNERIGAERAGAVPLDTSTDELDAPTSKALAAEIEAMIVAA
ncbi:N-acetylmuramidase domain-containing protein [Pararoseomonas sp. SCSIO 73927]|uniref:N-acetylmuramidase domain-containing protein n=1 Tax=Pararoseomonas sp. SCSIO 73927 TaxID=3114537 RepID=UPI0030D0EACF